METKDGAMVEIYYSPNSYGGVTTWETGGGAEAEKGSPPSPCATSEMIHRYEPLEAKNEQR